MWYAFITVIILVGVGLLAALVWLAITHFISGEIGMGIVYVIMTVWLNIRAAITIKESRE